MVETLWIVVFLIVVAVAGLLAYLYLHVAQIARSPKPHQGVVKHDWLPTGRIDFATRLDEVISDQNKERVARLTDLPAKWSRRHQMLGLPAQ